MKSLGILLMIAAMAGSYYFLQRLLVPKYEGQVIEGNFISEYYKETTPHDLLILGDCEVYENISPVTLWEDYGITSFIRGSAQQLIPQSYYLLEDALKEETPKAVLLSISAMQEGAQVNEAYNRMTMDGMRWSMSKVHAIQATKMEDESLVDYLIPFLRYHSRWEELGQDDLTYYWNRPLVSHNGYYMRADVQAVSSFPKERRLGDYRFPEISQKYLDRIRVLCENHGIRLILYKAPSLYPAWHDQWEEQIQSYADQYQLDYINCIPQIETIGLDFNTDTYNGGQHLNVYGAEKLSDYLGMYLKERVDFEDHRQDESYADVWQQKVAFYDQMKADQETEFAETGYLKKFASEE